MKMLIGGKWVDSVSEEVYSVINPATGEKIEEVPKGTREDVKKAVDAAKDAFKTWPETPQFERGKILYKAAQITREREKELSTLLTREQGKPLRESTNEINKFANICEYVAGMATALQESYIPLKGKGRYALVIRQPIGVCGAILPWNNPAALMACKVPLGLVAGNTFVVKPASTTPLTNLKLTEILEKAGIPPGVLNVVTGPGSVVGEAVIENPDIRKISFTGETATGRHIMEVASKTIKRLTLELGGSDPMIVCDDADIDAAVDSAVSGRFSNCGQRCIAVKRLYLFESIADVFTKKFVEKAQAIKVGNGLNPETTMGPLNNANQRKRVEELVDDAVKSGATVLTGAKRPVGPEFDNGFFYLPTVLTDVKEDAKMVKEECFGPAIPIFKVHDLDEAIAKTNDTIYGLGSCIWTSDMKKAHTAIEKIEAGAVWVNMNMEYALEVPRGGVKQSGVGREMGFEGLEHYTESKAVHVDLMPKKKP
jgi:succinate-semialdehyde dehydrogenase/glutarate-semialdehyde dehydrogenase